MSRNNLPPLLLTGLWLLLAGCLIFWPPADLAQAQCGSQASSCKNCHEVQGVMPVNADNTGWHEGHAFGDFCEFCHAGNVQSLDPAEAHMGLEPPLADVQTSCGSCHPADLMERAGIYAAALGIEVGTGGRSDTAPPTGGGSGPDEPPPVAQSIPDLVVDDPNIVDYNRLYDETVLGVRYLDWGNILLGALAAAFLVGGGGLVFWNERRLRGTLVAESPSPPAGEENGRPTIQPTPADFPAEVTELLPALSELSPLGLHSLKILLRNPEEASELLRIFSSLDPELIRRIRSLDSGSRAVLLTLVGR